MASFHESDSKHWKPVDVPPRKKRNTDHVIYDYVVGAFKCNHCGDVYKMALPCPLGVMEASMKAYLKSHRGCKKK